MKSSTVSNKSNIITAIDASINICFIKVDTTNQEYSGGALGFQTVPVVKAVCQSAMAFTGAFKASRLVVCMGRWQLVISAAHLSGQWAGLGWTQLLIGLAMVSCCNPTKGYLLNSSQWILLMDIAWFPLTTVQCSATLSLLILVYTFWSGKWPFKSIYIW